MAQTLDEWLDQHADRTLARQTSQLETAKLLVTFTLAVAATLVGTALQVGEPALLDVLAVIALGVAFILTVAAILLDRSKTANRRHAYDRRDLEGWDDQQLLVYLKLLNRDAEEFNADVVHHVRDVSRWQLAVSVVAAVIAAVSLLH